MGTPRRFLLATAEPHPTHRADVRVLFGKTLPACGIQTDLLALCEAEHEPPAWGGGRALLWSARSRVAALIGDVLQQCSLFWRCFRGYDGLIVRDKPVLALIGYLAARLARIPFCYWMSFPLPAAFLELSRVTDGSIGRLRRRWLWLRGTVGHGILYRFLIHRVDWLFVQSDVMARELRDIGLRHERITPVPMGVDIESIPPAAPDLPHALRGRRLGVYLGTLDRSRQPQLLVDAARLAAQRVPGFLLLVIGEADEPSDRGWAKSYAASVGALDCVHFTGRLPYQEGLALARHAEVGLSPFPRGVLLDSASPTKAVEYLACGVPVVCNDQPDQALVIERSGGGLVVPLDSEGFATGIERILSDKPFARECVRSGRAWVARHRGYEMIGRLVAGRLEVVAAGQRLASAVESEP